MPSVMARAKDGFMASLGEGANSEQCWWPREEAKAHRFPEDFIEMALDIPLNFHFL